MVDCSYCGTELKPGTGSIFVKKDGNAVFFCSRKCRTNMLKLKRSPRKWAKEKEKHKKKK
ncbi:MAG: 50S ribosomal protein L24e [Candidatus Diapherotrites archaeon]|nr:50S ribosomal protein L24e [Candidatus Diapherotrites archaeon]